MKTKFNSLNELWQNLEYCQICNDVCAEVNIYVLDNRGQPDIKKNKNILTIYYGKSKRSTKDKIIIDCKKNLVINKPDNLSDPRNIINKAKSIEIFSVCKNCGIVKNAEDININYPNIDNFEIGSETIQVTLNDRDYHVALDYKNNCTYIDDLDSELDDSSRVTATELIYINGSLDNLLKKINTILTFK